MLLYKFWALKTTPLLATLLTLAPGMQRIIEVLKSLLKSESHSVLIRLKAF